MCWRAPILDFLIYLSNPDGPNPYGLPQDNTRGGMPGSTSSDATFDRIRSWIADCTENHERCKVLSAVEHGAPAFYPDRLLDLRGGKIRLMAK